MEAPLICPACGNRDFSHYLDTADFSFTQEKFSLHQCRQCGTLGTRPQPDKSIIQHYYQSDKYISHTNKSDNWLISFAYRVARKFASTGKRKLIERYASGKDLLDLGCGTGYFLYEMKKAGWKVDGVEPSEMARQQAEIKLNQPVFRLLEEATGLSFSVITLWHVLEHLHRPDETLQRCNQLLKKGGILVVAVPNFNSYDADKYKKYWAGYDVPRHLWHFNKQSMNLLMNRQGFCINTILPMKLDSFYVSLLSEGYQLNEKNTIAKYWYAFKTGLQSNLIARKTGQYSSLIYIATKNNETSAN